MKLHTKVNTKGFAALETLLVVGVVGIVAFTAWFVVKNRDSANKQYDKIANSDNAITVNGNVSKKVVKLEASEIAKLKETPTKSTPVASNPTSSTPSKSTTTSQANTSPAAPTASAPSYSITISADGCTVSGYSTAGNHIEIGAFSSNKGGSVVYDFSTNETITKSSGGFKGMTAYGKTIDANGVTLAYHSATITADSCPAAG